MVVPNKGVFMELISENNIGIMKNKECTIALKANASKPCKETISGTSTCHECGKPMCPVCNRHNVTQLSRVTGYIGDVKGWNAGKQQELKDRKRYYMPGQ
jgi:anaerobic ribonucleoside-triphosphate reductase